MGRRTLRAEELAGDVELLAADNNNLLAVQELLGDRGGQAAEKVALAVDDNLCIPSASAVFRQFHPLSSISCDCALERGIASGHAYHRLEGRHFAAVSTSGD